MRLLKHNLFSVILGAASRNAAERPKPFIDYHRRSARFWRACGARFGVLNGKTGPWRTEGRHCQIAHSRLLPSGILAWLGLEREEAPEEDGLTIMVKRAILAAQQGDLVKAEKIFHVALRLAQDLNNREAITHIYCLLANLALERGHVAQAEKLLKTILQRILSDGFSQDDNAVVEVSLKLASIMHGNGEPEKARQGFDFCVDAQKKKLQSLGDAPPDEDLLGLLGMCLDRRAQFFLSLGKYREAEQDLREAVGVSQKLNGPQHQQTLVVSNSLATVLSLKGEHSQASDLMNDVVNTARSTKDEHLASFLINLGLMKLRQGMAIEAERSCREGLGAAKDEDVVREGKSCLELVEEAVR